MESNHDLKNYKIHEVQNANEKSLLLSSESAALAGVAIRCVSRHAANNKNLKY